MHSTKKSVLITGGCGFVGRHMCKRYHDLGYYVVAVDNLTSDGSKDPDSWPKHLFINDSMDFVFLYMSCDEFFQYKVPYFGPEPKWDIVIHLAAIVGGRNTIENEPLHVAEDLAIDSSFFLWASKQKHAPSLIVYFSSSAAYPLDMQSESSVQYRSLTESDLVVSTQGGQIGTPDLSYGWAKLTGEFLAQLAREKHGLNIAIYRPFSGFGEDQDDCYPFMSILNKVRKGNEVEIWSDSFRDFVYIEDVVDCVVETMEKVAQDKTVLNIASGVPTRFSELAKTIAHEIRGNNSNIVIKIANDRPKGVYYRVGDVTKSKEYGWCAKTSLQEAIRKINELS